MMHKRDIVSTCLRMLFLCGDGVQEVQMWQGTSSPRSIMLLDHPCIAIFLEAFFSDVVADQF